MDAIDQRQKTLVFCATQLHALAVRDLINQLKTSKEPNYCQRVTANDGRWANNTCGTSKTTRRRFPQS